MGPAALRLLLQHEQKLRLSASAWTRQCCHLQEAFPTGGKSQEPLLALPAVTDCCASCGRCSRAGHRGYAQPLGGTVATGEQRSDCAWGQVETRLVHACG